MSQIYTTFTNHGSLTTMLQCSRPVLSWWPSMRSWNSQSWRSRWDTVKQTLCQLSGEESCFVMESCKSWYLYCLLGEKVCVCKVQTLCMMVKYLNSINWNDYGIYSTPILAFHKHVHCTWQHKFPHMYISTFAVFGCREWIFKSNFHAFMI